MGVGLRSPVSPYGPTSASRGSSNTSLQHLQFLQPFAASSTANWLLQFALLLTELNPLDYYHLCHVTMKQSALRHQALFVFRHFITILMRLPIIFSLISSCILFTALKCISCRYFFHTAKHLTADIKFLGNRQGNEHLLISRRIIFTQT